MSNANLITYTVLQGTLDRVQGLSALVNQIPQPNSERNGYSVQLHDADIPYPSLYPGYERPM
jgi:hypothetical protein